MKDFQDSSLDASSTPASVNLQNGSPVCKGGQRKMDLSVKAAGSAQRWIYGFWPAVIKQSIDVSWPCDSSGKSTDNTLGMKM